MSVNAAIARAWDAMLAAHHEWHNALSRLADCDPAIKMTREKWLLPIVYELGCGHLEAITGGSISPGLDEATAAHFAISHAVS